MWTWSVFIALTMPNVMILCMKIDSDFEGPWQKPGYKLAMESSRMKPYVYRQRFPRKVYYSESSKGDSSLKPQERIPRSDLLIQPQLVNFGKELELPHVQEVNSLGIKSRLDKRKQLRRVAKNDAELQILDMDPLQLKEALILGLRSLAKRQATEYSAVSGLFHEGVPADLSETSSYTDNIYQHEENLIESAEDTHSELAKSSLYTNEKHEEKLIESDEDTHTELAESSLYTNEKHEDKLIEVSEDEPYYQSKSSLNTDDKHEDKLIEGPKFILNNVYEKPMFTNEKHHEKLIEGSESIQAVLSNPSLYSKDKHEDKIIESSETLIAEASKMSYNAIEKHEDKIIDSSEVFKGLSDIEFQIEPTNKEYEEYMDDLNYNDIVNVYEEKSVLRPLESKKQTNPKRNAKVNSYQGSIDDPPMIDVKTLLKGRNLDISNFLTPDKNSINAIDSQKSFNVPEESKIIDISKGDYMPKDNRIMNDDYVMYKGSEKSNDDEDLTDSVNNNHESQESINDLLNEEKSLENQKEENVTETITNASTESKTTENPNEDNQKDKNDDSTESKDLDSGNTDKEENGTETSEESKESSNENNESSEEVNSVEKKPLPTCPDSMDPSFRVDYKGETCSSDNDCKEEGEFCCKAYSNINRCWSNLTSDAMDVTPSE